MRGDVGAQRAHQCAADLGDAHLQVHLTGSGRAQPGDDIGLLAHEGLHQAGGFGGILGVGHGAGQQHGVGAKGGDGDMRLGHGQRDHVIHAVEIGTHPQIGRPDGAPRRIAGIDGGGAAALGENIKLTGGFHLHIGHLVVRDKDILHRLGQGDQLATPHGQGDVMPWVMLWPGGLAGCGSRRIGGRLLGKGQGWRLRLAYGAPLRRIQGNQQARACQDQAGR